MIKVVIIDNHDSFTWNLYQLFTENVECSISVIQNQDVKIEDIGKYDKIVFSPGPDIPRRYPEMMEILNEYASKKSILGVCLGHQAIVEYFGGKIKNMEKVFHGIKETIEIDSTELLFKEIQSPLEVGLYHSWAVDEEYLPDCFSITARSRSNVIMAVSHLQLDIKGMQFHPESFMTLLGGIIINNWIRS